MNAVYRLLAGLLAQAGRLGEAEAGRRLEGLAGQVAGAFPEIEVRREGERLVLVAPGLRQRAWGTRTKGPDPRLAMLAAWLAQQGAGGGRG